MLFDASLSGLWSDRTASALHLPPRNPTAPYTCLVLEMSRAPTESTTPTVATSNNPPMMPTGKAATAAPKLSEEDHVELTDMLPAGPEIVPEEDIMQLARLGDIQGIEKLYESGKFDASYCDVEGITPLHVFRLDCSF